MPIIDPNKNPVGLDVRLQGETNSIHRKMLEEVRFHIAVEAATNIEPALQRLAPKAEYLLFEYGKPPVTIAGLDAIRRDFYESLFGFMDPRLEWDIVTCMVDGRTVVTEGLQKNAVRGSALRALGFSDVDPDKMYLQHARHMVLWPFDDKLRLVGETVYFGSCTPLEEVAKQPLKPEDIGVYSGQILMPSALEPV